MNKRLFTFLFIFIAINSFGQGFKKVSSSESNITFTNQINETELVNGLTYLYLYNGGGVAVGDINNDGLEDIYFTGNLVSDKLYLNQGKMRFKDVTEKYFGKNLDNSFHTGVSMVDINNDGWLDIYVSCAGPGEHKKENLLYINNKGKGFNEEAEKYGLNDSLNTTQTVFFDFDLDGDLDAYVLNHTCINANLQSKFPNQKRYKILGKDHFYLNENGKYREISDSVGINSSGFGLGVVIVDYNNDNYPDIYVTNDYDYPDKLFKNNGNGTFTETIKNATQHISIYAMGVDAGDINNDGYIDLMTVDMASEDHVRSKKNMGGMSTKNFWNLVNRGNHYQYMFNSLQLNLGNGVFGEIAQLSGISKTDWSWAPLFADFDNDGYQDLFVSNGFARDVRDNDFFIKYEKEIKHSSEKMNFNEILELIPSVKIPNYIFKNNGDLTFSKTSFEWGLSESVNVNGAAYSDLDNDGDLDLIYNVINGESFIMENQNNTNKHHYLNISIGGLPNNINCIGSKIEIGYGNEKQFKELQVVKGFQSSVSPILHFGLGNISKVDYVKINWNDKEETLIENVSANQILSVNYQESLKVKLEPQNLGEMYFKEIKINGLSNYLNQELAVNDFEKEVLLPHKMSELGPFVLVEDFNEDGLEDMFVGGSRGYAANIFHQKKDGSFELIDSPSLSKDKNFEDMQALFFDYDNDGDKDLYIVSGSNEAPIDHASLNDRIYKNDGGVFVKADHVLPQINVSGQKVISKDINDDGWIDLVVFGRQIPGAYPSTPKSTILINDKGVFTDKTKLFAPELEHVGMVTDALFTDFDSDGDDDLICVGEWMPITVFENKENVFTNITTALELNNTVGWWSAIKEISVDRKKKYILGNIGKNNKFHPSVKKPLQIYMNDFDKNGTNDIVLAKNQNNICYPVRGRQCSSEQMPFIIDKFPTYDQYATADLKSIYTKEMLDASVHFNATQFENSILSFSDGQAMVEHLPNELQTGCINTILKKDINHDGIMDYVLLGNKYEAEVETIRYDGNLGYLVLGTQNGGFKIVPNYQSGLYLNTNVKSASFIKVNNQDFLVVASTNDHLKIYKTQ